MTTKSFELTLNNILDHPEVPCIPPSPSFESCLDLLNAYRGQDKKQIFPYDNVPACRSVSVDYGRSHYFFTDGEIDIPELVHMYCYRNYGEVTDEEREAFFRERIGLDIDPVWADDVTPTRGFIVARTKYELLCEWWRDNGFEGEDRYLAFLGMYYTTQHPLRYIKGKIIDALYEQYGTEEIEFRFSFVRIDFTVEQAEPILTVTYLNFAPKKENWQVLTRLPEGNPHKIIAKFQINLHDLESNGTLLITTKGTYSKKSKDLKKCYGVYNASKKKVIKYRDTLPTW
eukprot:TRINITY_DN2621_c0_g1_i1.p1 TRINITY_DN2621_c0_g1~~TRINITY_DN2621_c0_g1_i1.p1  ORF type:complete len:303 (+),score=41.97 TRINITY_DN2621_c0_g1_i1:52-909(+)